MHSPTFDPLSRIGTQARTAVINKTLSTVEFLDLLTSEYMCDSATRVHMAWLKSTI